MLYQRPSNNGIFVSVLILAIIGLIFIFSSSSVPAEQNFKDLFFFVKRQGFTFLFGLITGFVIYRTPLSITAKLILPLYLLTAILLLATHVPGLGKTVNGASRWLSVGGLSFQPAELAKLAIIMLVAKNLSRRGFSGLDHMRGIMSCLTPLAIYGCMLMLQPDFGSTFLLCLVVFAMMFVSGLKARYITATFIFGILGILAAIWQAPYRMNRITSFVNPWDSAQTGGFQIIQSYLGFYNGGLTGLGVGGSRQKLFFLPEAHTDFILSVIGEELGLAGLTLVLGLFTYLVAQGFLITSRQSENFKKILAFGLTCLIAFQASINMGVSVGLLPTKGMPLPFISHGSSSLLIFLWIVAILARINQESDGTHDIKTKT